MSPNSRRGYLSALGSAALFGLAGCLDGGQSTDTPTAGPIGESATFDVYVTASGDALGDFEKLTVPIETVDLVEEGPINECLASPRFGTASPSPTPESTFDLDCFGFGLNRSVDLADGPSFLGEFTVPAAIYTFGYLEVGAPDATLSAGGSASFAGKTSIFNPVPPGEMRVNAASGTTIGMHVNVDVSKSDGDYVLTPQNGKIGEGVSVSGAGDPQLTVSATFEKIPKPGQQTKLQVFVDGEPAGNLVVFVNGGQSLTRPDGTFTVDLPQDAEGLDVLIGRSL